MNGTTLKGVGPSESGKTMNIKNETTRIVTITLDEREAKVLMALIGALSPIDAELLLDKSIHKDEVLPLKSREMVDFTGSLYDGLWNGFNL